MYYLNTLVNSCIQNRRKMTLTVCPLRSFERFLREGFNKKTKKIWIYPYLGGWVGQDGDNIHKKNKKNMPLKSILDHSKSF